jgi:hypothetical protein
MLRLPLVMYYLRIMASLVGNQLGGRTYYHLVELDFPLEAGHLR